MGGPLLIKLSSRLCVIVGVRAPYILLLLTESLAPGMSLRAGIWISQYLPASSFSPPSFSSRRRRRRRRQERSLMILRTPFGGPQRCYLFSSEFAPFQPYPLYKHRGRFLRAPFGDRLINYALPPVGNIVACSLTAVHAGLYWYHCKRQRAQRTFTLMTSAAMILDSGACCLCINENLEAEISPGKACALPQHVPRPSAKKKRMMYAPFYTLPLQ